MNYDFCGWATKNDLKCLDGRIIRKGAFTANNGKIVPLVWNHRHNSASDVLGHALLEDRDDGVYAYCSFNNTTSAKDAKEVVKHGDVVSLSVWANNLVQNGADVVHGVIREVSLVLAGANPGAFVESVMAHGQSMDIDDDEGIFYNDDGIFIQHAGDPEEGQEESENDDDDNGEEENMEGKTVKEVINSMTDEQKQAMAIVVGQALEEAGIEDDDDENEGGDEMRHSIFDEEAVREGTYLSHSDMETIFADAKRNGSLKEAVQNFFSNVDGDGLLHSIDTTGMTLATGTQTYGFNDPSMLFPEYKTVNGATPEWLSRNMDWVNVVMNGVHHTPFSRIKSVYANITEDEARAKGYIKANQKKEEVFTTLKRTTDPQTIYKLQKMDRDDIIDITDFDVVTWIRAEMRVMLDEEIARAILIGDGRPADSDDKIKEINIRPIVKEPPLYNTVVKVSAGSSKAELAKSIINESIRARKHYKGSGNPTFFTTEDYLTEMLLLEDNNGRKLYKTEEELATALRVSKIVTVEVMEGQKVDELDLIAIIVNLADYNVGADKGGNVSMFDDFDIKYNQQLYLIETRISGALIKPYSALTLVKTGTSGLSARSKGNE